MHVELKHTLTVDRNAWYIRCYVWLWEANVRDITFCKLFWAYVFIVPGLFFHGLFELFERAGNLRKKHKRQKVPKITMRLETPPAAPSGPSPMQRLLARIEHAMTRVVMAIKAGWSVIGMGGKLALFLGRVLIGIGLLIGLAALGVIVWVLVEFSTARYIAVGAIVVILVALLVVGIVIAFDHLGVWGRTGEGLGYGGRGIKRGASGFWSVMVAGYVAIKSNTCPKVEVK